MIQGTGQMKTIGGKIKEIKANIKSVSENRAGLAFKTE